MKNIGFIGLGSMGFHMAKNLINEKNNVFVFDVNKEAMNNLESMGAKITNSPMELGSKSDVVFIMVQNYNQCLTIINGDQGLLEGLSKEDTVIITSTISPSEVKDLARICEKFEVNLLDSPVSGGVKGSQQGKLTLMVSGDENIYDQCLSILDVIGENIIFVGEEVGMGQSIKAVNQYLVSIHLLAMSEALALGVKSGLSPEMIHKVVKISAGNSKMFEEKVLKISQRDFSTQGLLALQNKDLDICLEIGRELNVPLFLGSQSKEIFKIAKNMDLFSEDICSLIKVYESKGGFIASN